MGYLLHIERFQSGDIAKSIPIPLEDWKKALLQAEGVRLCTAETYSIKDISIPHRDGDAEVYFPEEQKWHAVFRWFNGIASFKASIALEKLPNPIWTAAAALTSNLGAVIRGDEGERYDSKTGKVNQHQQPSRNPRI